MHEPALERAIQARWDAWLRERNGRGTAAMLWMGLFLYPAFGVVDWLNAPDALGPLWSLRAVIVVVTLALMRVRQTEAFQRHQDFWAAAYLVFGGTGISLMTVYMGGLASPYYAGLNLLVAASGLLFVWPARVVVPTHLGIATTYLALNVALGERVDVVAGVSNLFFLLATALIIAVGQVLNYAAARAQVEAQVVADHTRARLEEAHEKLKELDRFKSMFFANMTHELKTPLALILTPLEIALDGARDGMAALPRTSLEAMYRAGVKLLKLIDDLLDLSRIEESKLTLRLAEHDLAPWLRNLAQQVEPLAARKQLTLDLDIPAAGAPAWCDLDRLERVLVNLLSNALKFTPVDGHIAVRLKDDGDAWRIEVEDDGPGFPPEMADRLFERFFQVDMDSTRKFGGAGIGLALARELVELHGGTLTAASGPGRGALLVLRLQKGRPDLPSALVDAAPEPRLGLEDFARTLEERNRLRLLDIDTVTERRVVPRDPDERRHRHTILVVDDTPDVLRVIHLTLHEHFRILAAQDGAKGLELAVRHQPSVIVLDRMMPEIDGREVARRLRADPRTRHIPIVMLTARNSPQDRVEGVEAGVDRYLGKPFSAAELLATVRALAEQQEDTAAALLRQQMDSLEVVTAGLAHQVNNPLNYLRQALVVVGRDLNRLVEAGRGTAPPLSPGALAEIEQRVRRMMEAMEIGVQRIAATVDLMRRYARDGYSRTPQPYDVFAAAQDVVRLLRATAPPTARMEVRLDGDGRVMCVPDEMNQVLVNLVQNAVDALGDQPGEVRLRGWTEGDAVHLTVTDSGPGVPAELRTRIFAPFFSTKGPGHGMGMGLTICQRVVTAAGGTITLRGGEGEGAEFHLRLPGALRGPSAQAP